MRSLSDPAHVHALIGTHPLLTFLRCEIRIRTQGLFKQGLYEHLCRLVEHLLQCKPYVKCTNPAAFLWVALFKRSSI